MCSNIVIETVYWLGVSVGLACPPNRYGFQCLLQCRCENGALCDPMDGSCKCKEGFRGTVCDQGEKTIVQDTHTREAPVLVLILYALLHILVWRHCISSSFVFLDDCLIVWCFMLYQQYFSHIHVHVTTVFWPPWYCMLHLFSVPPRYVRTRLYLQVCL